MITLRNAEKDELHSIREHRIQAYLEHSKVLPEDHWQGLKQAISTDSDSHSAVELIIAELDGEIAGSVALFPSKTDAYDGYVEELDYPEIRMLAVTPEARGQGVAKALIEECIQRARGKGYQAIGLHTGSFMENAIKLYEGFGFERVPEYDFEPANDGIIVKAFKLTIK